MIRLGTLFWLVLVSATGFAMFGVKYQVQALEDELARTNRATAAEEHELRVLEAEWAYLTRPATLEAMNRQFLSLGPIATKQLHTTAADIPLRPPPPPAGTACRAEPPAIVAAAEPAPAASAAPSAPEGVPVQASGTGDTANCGRAARDAKRAARHARPIGETGGGAAARPRPYRSRRPRSPARPPVRRGAQNRSTT